MSGQEVPVTDRMVAWLRDPALVRYFVTFGTTGLRNGWVEVAVLRGIDEERLVHAFANSEYGRWSSCYREDRFGADTASMFPLGKLGEALVAYERPEHMRPWVPAWCVLKEDVARRIESGRWP